MHLECFISQVWKTCQSILGKTGRDSVMRHISGFDPKDCYLDVALSAKTVIEPYSLEQIRDVSAGAATFFVWVSLLHEVFVNVTTTMGSALVEIAN